MSSIRLFPEIAENDRAVVGGKALSLARLSAAGFRVPAGFVITAEALESGIGKDGALTPELAREVVEARARLGEGPLAVRSSAAFEDAAAASFAGQLETVLGVREEADLLDAIAQCWRAGRSSRVEAYRRERTGQAGNRPSDPADTPAQTGIALVVQTLIEADAAGVLFTADVASGHRERMLIESAWGLGELVVSGVINPDRFAVEKSSGEVLEREIADKQLMKTSTGRAEVPPERRDQPSLTAAQIAELASLGRRLEEVFGCPQDVEWAVAGGAVYLLQARPITTLDKPADDRSELEPLRRQELARLGALAHPRGTIWSSYGISEILPEPLPMTWALVAEFMSGRGGLGRAYADLGFVPSPEVCEKGMLELICGRPYVNLQREIQMHLAEFLYEYDFAQIKADPSRASYPTPRRNLALATGRTFLRLPFLAGQMILSGMRLPRLRHRLAGRLNGEVFPQFAAWAAAERAQPLDALGDAEILERFEACRRRVMCEFVREALQATVLSDLAYANLRTLLETQLGAEAGHYLAALASGERADVTVEMDEALWRVGTGEKPLDEFLAAYGHRAVGEFELARPRWREDPPQVERLAHLAVRRGEHSPAELYGLHRQHLAETMERLQQRLKRLGGAVRDRIERETAVLHRYLPFRESVKHYWMMGYELLRRCLLELDRRHGLEGGIFFLRPHELPELFARRISPGEIAERRRIRELLLRIPVPPVVFSDDLEAIGRPHEPLSGDVLTGVGVSEGAAAGLARVLLEPAELGEQDSGYVLVCPSTDPGWTPLFARARALVMERGGMLSHGAIVAREYGLPAVVNVADATLRIAPGRRVRVDGDQGKVWLL